MKRVLIFCTLLSICASAVAQDGSQSVVNKLPDFVPPTPEVSNLIKADQLTVGFVTGSPNISIPLATLQTGGYSLHVTLNYSSTGLKVDEYASMVGIGWTLNYGGVISRTVMDKPDENRTQGNHNLMPLNFTSYTSAELNFLKYAVDKELDIFTFSFPGYSGKFILDSNYLPVQLTKNNLKIERINSNFLNGFIVTTDDGTAYHFQDYETSTSRNPSGSNCEKIYDNNAIRTSWYLTKIVLPSTQKEINFTYTTTSITFEHSIVQTISKATYSEQYSCASNGPTGNACTVGTEHFSTCISQQVVTAKFISKIQTSDGDKIEFTYDGTSRADLQDGKRLSAISATNRYARVIRKVEFTASYQTSIHGSTSNNRNKRMFLETVGIRGGEITSVSGPLTYAFTYNDYGNLPSRLSYCQDFYGYYNGKTSNASLIPTLPSTDVNYSAYSNGTGATLVQFGDRSIDTSYARKGMLTKIAYPTGGYDTLVYLANRFVPNADTVEKLTGGFSVSRILSYTDPGSKALERQFIYRYKSNNALSSFLLTEDLKFSQVSIVKRDGFLCGSPHAVHTCIGPACHYAVVTSNANNPIASFGAQHIYYRSVLEVTNGSSTNNGMIEHKYWLFTLLGPHHLMNNNVLNAPFQIVPDIVLGENMTNVYKNTGSGYALMKSTERKLRIADLDNFKSYVVKRNGVNICDADPPLLEYFDPFDIDEYYVNTYTVVTDTVIEKEYTDAGATLTKLTKFEYANSAYTYPTRITTTGSDGIELKTERKYASDYSGLSFMTSRNIISPVLEEKQLKANTVLSTLTHKYKDWFSNATVVAPDTSELKFGTSSNVQRILYHGYDTHGNVSEVSKGNDERYSYIWDYNKNFAIAKVQNASVSTIAYTSFEADGAGGFTLSGTVLNTGGITGYNAFNGTVSQTVASGNYVVTLWTKTSASVSVNSTSGTAVKTIGNWKLMEWNLSSVTSVSVTGTEYDELRLYPKGALMSTFCYEPMVGVISQSDVNNRLSYYEYDGLGRLMLVRDQDKNIIKKFCYNYAGQPEACDVYYSEAQSQSFTRNCGPDSTGSSVTYSIPAGKYSGYSLADANAKALAEVAAFGQASANAKGTCVLTCTTSNCTGASKKCINNVCETGYKVYTASVQIGTHLWQCTYHYEWSDSSWSQNYTEEQPTSCPLSEL